MAKVPVENIECFPRVTVRAAFGYDTAAASKAVAVKDFGPTRTVQADAAETDINLILKRFGVTGMVPQNVRVPTYEDFEDVFDFQSAQNAIVEAQRSFMAMPPEIRSRFNNDPQTFLEFCSDEANLDEMRKMGLAVKKAEPDKPAPPSGG